VSSYRITKFDPALRNADGAYLSADWTSSSDVGREFNGVVLTESEYARVEDAYITTAVRFFEECGIDSLTVTSLESTGSDDCVLVEGQEVTLEQAADIARQM
jgi:hypothetical protein